MKAPEQVTQSSPNVRLHKFMAEQGVGSRRKAEELIRRGDVRVNGKKAEIGQKVDPCKDSIFVKNRPLQPLAYKPLTLVLHKPKGILCTHSDPFHDKTIFTLLPPRYRDERLLCAGRLDKDSEGLVILTNDGVLAHRLTHPTFRIVKRYWVTLDKPLDPQSLPRLLKGVRSDGEFLRVDKVYLPSQKNHTSRSLCEVHLCHGRKREIRRLFEALRYRVKRLVRFQIGGLRLRGLPRGTVRPLSTKEISALAPEPYPLADQSVLRGGLEPPHLAAQGPEPCVSTNSTI